MKTHKKIKYTDEKIGKIKIISNLLPSPDDLVRKENAAKAPFTLNISGKIKQNVLQ